MKKRVEKLTGVVVQIQANAPNILCRRLTRYPTQSHYTDTGLTNPALVLK